MLPLGGQSDQDFLAINSLGRARIRNPCYSVGKTA